MKHIIVVDDDELMREVLSQLLEKDAYRVSAFASAAEALQTVFTGSPDLILTDVKMPGMSGPELIKKVREMGIVVPVIFITGNPTDELHDFAKELGVREILIKPLKDLSVISSTVKNALSCPGYEGIRAGLDELRLSFLDKLAHELRTPITALGISMDELFAVGAGRESETSRNLLTISRRNLGRIVKLVERQIDLLQVALGRVSVSRHLVDVGEIVNECIPGNSSELSGNVARVANLDQRRMYLFTDPDLLTELLEWILGEKKNRHGKNVSINLEKNEDRWKLVFISKIETQQAFQNDTNHSCRCNVGGLSFCPISLLSESGVEMRACQTIIEALEGELSVEENGSGKQVRLALPVLPVYDRKKDFISPLRNIRETAQSSGKSVNLLKCEIISEEISEEDEVSLLYEFIERCRIALTEGDTVVRSRQKGRCYLALLDRRPEDINHAIEFLQRSWNELEENGRNLDVLLLQNFTPDMKDTEVLSVALDTIS